MWLENMIWLTRIASQEKYTAQRSGEIRPLRCMRIELQHYVSGLHIQL